MTEPFDTVAAPVDGVYRVARRGSDPFAPPPWGLALDDGTFGNRYDGPSVDGRPPYRVVYCATTAQGAFGETLARFRPSLTLLARLRDISDDDSHGLDSGLGRQGLIPKDWRARRVIAHAHVRVRHDPSYVDLATQPSLQVLRTRLAPVATRLGLPNVDLSTLTGWNRGFTQACSRFIYDQIDDKGYPAFTGIRYLSRLGSSWECWAFFSDRVAFDVSVSRAIPADDVALADVARLFHLSID